MWAVNQHTCQHQFEEISVGILRYFKRSATASDLPDPHGPLSKELQSHTIRVVNKKIKPDVEKINHGERELYVKLTPSQRALVGKRAAENGVTATIRHFAGKYKGCDFIGNYCSEAEGVFV